MNLNYWIIDKWRGMKIRSTPKMEGKRPKPPGSPPKPTRRVISSGIPKQIGPLGDECPNCEYRELYYDYETNTYHCSHCGGLIPEKTSKKDGAAVPSPAETKETK